ncbi:cysteine desulfuration protein SufE [Vibrio sp. vnigr-6D03]|uniref:Cysteine desulfuration protein SufE n=1 Tax=Vibrio penaeicida TaxID=104609 RepID=A0AAV5NZY9_9VIBR|nr:MULTISPECIES: cysteine desulfuration protein SufE [Vibrio]MDP2572644.1 cysteine desulfuration protein SufE [Vibrio penaeicida]PKF80088.1 cysteine desulfuration protein SufE [Vibrio sp. vnigr-6D03]RTZ23139.1 cysteine desulfuration protein SufE [Vibrio penaeicida]GLQ76266.1 cysteine desulfuration protein SufE [Vibrio penaeicida]
MTPEKLVKNFNRCQDWEERYLYIIELGDRLNAISDDKRTDDYLIKGCQSQVWLDQVQDEKGAFHFFGDSDAAIVKGLIAVTVIAFEGKTSKEILDFDINQWFEELELHKHITPTRSQGLSAMVASIQKTAEIYS